VPRWDELEIDPATVYTCTRCRRAPAPPERIVHVAECECGERWAICSECGGNSQVVDALLEAHAGVCRMAPHNLPPSAA